MKLSNLLVVLFIGISLGYWVRQPDRQNKEEAMAEKRPDETAKASQKTTQNTATEGKKAKAPANSEEALAITKAWLESLEEVSAFDRIGRLHQRLKTVAPSEFKPLIESLVGMRGTALTWQAQSLIAARWAEVDPQGLRQYIDTQPMNQQWGLISGLYSTWAEKDADEALTAASEINSWNMRQMALTSIASAVAEKDPIRAVAIINEHFKGSMQGGWGIQQVYQQWARRDPEAARQAALTMEDGTMKSSALAGAMGEWMAAEPMAALAWLDSLPADSVIHRTREELFRNLMGKNLDAAKEYIENQSSPLHRREALEAMHFWDIVWSQDGEGIRETMDWLGTVAKGKLHDQKIQELIGSLAHVDADSAIEYMQSMSPGEARIGVIGSIAGKLAEQNPSKALEFIGSLEYEDERERALQNMGWHFARNSVETTSALISESNDPMVQQRLTRNIAEEWSSYDTAAALAWVESLQDKEAQSNGLEAVLANWVQEDPAHAMAYVENSIDKAEQANVYRSLFNQWIYQDAETAVQWLEKMPEVSEEQQIRLYGDVTRNYFRQDPMEASKWVENLKAGPERDQSVETLVQNVSDSDPEAAFIWAQTLRDDNKRERSLQQTLQKWIQKDPEAAENAIRAAEITDAEKTQLLETLEKKQ
ncbi:MAG: hypothetical protein ACON39_06040 [Coraliomargaritaceae bacterium]